MDENVGLSSALFEERIAWLQQHYGELEFWTAPGSLEAVTSGKVGAHGIQEAASR
jgi:hypothetical protein